MNKLLVGTFVTAAIVSAISGPVHAKKGNKSKSNAAQTVEVAAPAAAAVAIPQAPATVHTGIFNVEVGGVTYTCHNYCSSNTLTAVDNLY